MGHIVEEITRHGRHKYEFDGEGVWGVGGELWIRYLPFDQGTYYDLMAGLLLRKLGFYLRWLQDSQT